MRVHGSGRVGVGRGWSMSNPVAGPGRGWESCPMTTTAARVLNLTKTYGSGDALVRALDDVSLDLYAGEFTAVMGPSGRGSRPHALLRRA